MLGRTLMLFEGICYFAAIWILLQDNNWRVGIVPIILFIIHLIFREIGVFLVHAEVETRSAEKMNEAAGQLEKRIGEFSTEIRLLRVEIEILRGFRRNDRNDYLPRSLDQ